MMIKIYLGGKIDRIEEGEEMIEEIDLIEIEGIGEIGETPVMIKYTGTEVVGDKKEKTGVPVAAAEVETT